MGRVCVTSATYFRRGFECINGVNPPSARDADFKYLLHLSGVLDM